MNAYECMYIIQTNLSDEEADKTNARIAEEIEKRGGSVLQRERLGKKRLAYPIAKQDDGAYYLMYFELPPGEIAGLRSAYRLEPRLLRSLILRKQSEETAKAHKREPARAETGETPSEADEEEPTGDEDEGEAPATGPEAEPATGEASAPSGSETQPDRQE